jgi:alpha-glucoside transport system substrate-binding protein
LAAARARFDGQITKGGTIVSHYAVRAVFLAFLVLSAGCGPRSSTAPATTVIGGSVSVLGLWGGAELDSFRAMVTPFEERHGVKVVFEGTRDLNAVLTTRVQGGNPPDIVILPGPGVLAEFANAGQLKALDQVVDLDAMREDYAATWLDLGRVSGNLYGIFVKTALKGLLWHNPKALARDGYALPTTWEELLGLTRRMAQGGKAPWCIGLESGAASGWPGTDWIEILLLKAAGPEVYDRWYRHEIGWDHPDVRAAWRMFGEVTNPAYLHGGRQGALATNFAQAAFPLFASPPGCYLHLQATFIQDFIQKQYPNLTAAEDYNFVPMPGANPAHNNTVEAGGDLVAMFKETPQAQALVRYLATPEAQAIWVKRGGALSPNKRVALDAYPDPLSRRAAEILIRADAARFDASDLMPEAVNNAFWKAVLDFVSDPSRLEEILTDLERRADAAYR